MAFAKGWVTPVDRRDSGLSAIFRIAGFSLFLTNLFTFRDPLKGIDSFSEGGKFWFGGGGFGRNAHVAPRE